MKVFQFKLKNNNDNSEISTPIYIKNNRKQQTEKGNAVWDTGATSSMISAIMAKKLQLVPIGTAQIAGVHGIKNTKCYLIDIIFQNGFIIENVKVSEASDFGGFDLLVGMDIIGKGILLINGINGEMKVLFQFPIDSSN